MLNQTIQQFTRNATYRSPLTHYGCTSIVTYGMICAKKDYFKRICDGVLAEELAGMGAVLVQGPKWCGKTTTCEQLAKSVLYMNDPKRRSQYLGSSKNLVEQHASK